MSDLKAAYGVVARVIDVPSSGVSYLRIEIPVEHHAEATQAFYGKRVLVTLADLEIPYGIVTTYETQPIQPVHPAQADKPKMRPLCHSAVMLCNGEGFQGYVAGLLMRESVDAAAAADYLRQVCGIGSRRELDEDAEASRLFRRLMERYRAWMERQERAA